MQALLKEEHQCDIPYSTLTRKIRNAQLRPSKRRAGSYAFGPGEEMEHDTSPHRLLVAEKKVIAQCASLTLAYSRRVFIQYYPRFTRFEAKAFLAEALAFMGGACQRCIIDNTSVVLASGSGNEALIAPEMAELGRAYGFSFKAHAIGHADRKAHVERNFHYVENNFLVARLFSSWEDLNQQARNWCETVANAKQKKSLGMSPDAAFVLEKPYLQPLPNYRLPIHDTLNRHVNVDAFVIVDTNRYSVPEKLLGKTLEVHKHLNRIEIFFNRKKIATHPRLVGMRSGKSTLPGHHLPLAKKRAHRGPCAEEQALVGHSELLDAYVSELKKRSKKRGVTQLRRLLELKRSYPATAVHSALSEASKYGLYDLGRLERLILEHVSGDFFNLTDEEEP
jgi:Mu transposase-like protein